MKPLTLIRISLLGLSLGLGTVAVRAEDLGAVKARMEQRVPSIDGLKDRGVAGENNRGYLEARGSVGPEEQKIISDENADRRTVYVELARQYGTDPENVGQRRAHQIALNSKRGVWIQARDGTWAQKG